MNALEQFCALVAGDDPPLLAGAAHIGRCVDPASDPAKVIDSVASWSDRLQRLVPADASPVNRLRMLNHFFFDELGFGGNADDYYDPANSDLNQVITRRVGIPISLAVLYIALGQSIGLKLSGVGFPGHFLVGLPLAEGTLYLDVFDGGVSLTPAALRERLAGVVGERGAANLEPHLRAVSSREILARMLRNLKNIVVEHENWSAALEVQQRLVALLPNEAEERRTRALLFDRLECPRAAAQDLVAYLSMHPSPPDADDMRRLLGRLQSDAQRLN